VLLQMLDLGSRGHGALLIFFRREWEISALQHDLASTLIGVGFLLITERLSLIFYWGHIKLDSIKGNTVARKILFFL
jgi:hypothetical protein